MEDKAIIKEIRESIKKGDINKFMDLLDKNPNLLNQMTPFGTWLHIAAKRGELQIIEYLVSKGVNVNAIGGTFDANALKIAAGSGQLEVVRYLLNNGSLMDISLAKRNPLFGAIYGGHINVVKELVKRGIDISKKYTNESFDNIDAYEYARQFGQTEIAEYLKSKLEEK